ncbi:hypothetical protein BOX15_Mlig019227g2, partial [Macrostomum lignano]
GTNLQPSEVCPETKTMVLRKARRFICHPVGLVLLVSLSCCLYIYILLMVTATTSSHKFNIEGSAAWIENSQNGSQSASSSGGSTTSASSIAIGYGVESLPAIKQRHTRLLWDKVNAIAKSKDRPSWNEFEARVLAGSGPALACSLPRDNQSAAANLTQHRCGSQLPSDSDRAGLAICQSKVRGPLKVAFNLSLTWQQAADMVSADIASTNSTRILPGGAWCPSAKCRHQQSLAIVIPFRDRWRQLRNLLSVLHPMLQRQQSGCYRVFVVEQYGGGAFNKGRLNNAGFLEAMRRHNFTCVIFQDTDIVPENDRNPYLCGSVRPRHLAVAVDTNRYRLPYAALVGGVIAFTTRHFFRVNGYSNLYWGWGLEDDDMELRMKIGTKLKYERPPASVARFKALPHASQRIYRLQASRRMPLLKTALQRYSKDGLNTVKYRVLFSSNEPLFTHLLIDIGEQPLDFELTGTE